MITYLLLFIISFTFYWIGRRFTYWKERAVPCVEPSFPLGNLQGMTNRHVGLIVNDVYQQLKGSGNKLGGMYFFIRPVALVLDLDFAKDVIVKEFQHFHDRGMYYNDKADPLTCNLVTLEGSRWKNLRAKLTPTFSSTKMKAMFPIMTAIADEFVKCLTIEADGLAGGEIEMKDMLSRFTTDIIGSCAFGLECNSLKDPETEFRIMGRKSESMSKSRLLRRMFAETFNTIARAIGLTIVKTEVTDFYMETVRSTIEYREKSNVHRNDFMDLLIKMKANDDTDLAGKLTFNEIAAQAFVFFLAGFESSSTVLAYCLFELTQNQEVQDRARLNVEEVLIKYGSMTYEAVHEMRYIENCINESLRKYPPILYLPRLITKDYYVRDMNVTLEKGFSVAIPVYAIHHDQRYYPNPEIYDPDRFNPEETAKRHPMAFIPFGEGPRICIAKRFGMMQACVGLAYLLKHFRFTLSPKTITPLKIVPTSLVSNSEGGLWLHIEQL